MRKLNRLKRKEVNGLARAAGILFIGCGVTGAGAQEVRLELSAPIHRALPSGRVVRPNSYAFLKPVPFTPFKYELPPGHPVDPNSKITLPTGKVVTVREYIDSLNRIERGLAQVGHTMRAKVGHIIGPKYGDDALFSRQVAAYRGSIDAKFTPWHSKLVTNSLAGASALIGQTREAPGRPYIPLNPKGDTTTQSKASGKGFIGATNSMRDPREFPNPLLMTYGTAEYFDKGFSGGFGDSNFGATVSAHLKITGTSNPGTNPAFASTVSEMHAQADMAADAQVMGNSFRLLQFTASATGSDKTNTRSYDLGLYVGGVQIFHDGNSSHGPMLSWQDGFSINWDAQSPTFVFPLLGPFEMKGFVGVKGNAGVTGSFKVRSFSVAGEFAPFVTASAYGEVTAGIDLGVASADVGVHADLVLLDDHLTFKLDAGLGWDPVNHFTAAQNCLLENKLTCMSGSFSLVAHVYGPWGFKLYDWSTELAGWPGEYSDLVFSKPSMVKLSWH